MDMVKRSGRSYKAGRSWRPITVGLATLLLAAIALPASADTPFDCSQVPALGLAMQVNLHASALLVQCGIQSPGNPNAPTTNITSSLYGKITGFHDPRLIQLGAKLYF